MKTNLTILLFCCAFGSFYSQDYPCDPKTDSRRCGQWEIGINLFSFQQEETNRDKLIIIPAYTSGIILKKHCNNHAWRFAFDRFDYRHFEKTYDDVKPRWWYEANYRTIKNELRLGWEYFLINRRLQPYIALDATLGHKKINIASIGEGDFVVGVQSGETTKAHQYAALSSSFGLRYQINERLSLSAETNVGFYYEQIKSPADEKDYYDRSDTFYHLLRSFAVHYKF